MPLVLDIFGLVIMHNGLNKPVLDLCAHWRGQGEQVYGATNMTALQCEELWQLPGIREAFDNIYSSGGLGVSKPDPVFYTAVTAKISASPEQIMFFDDSGVNVEAAQRCGWQARVYTDVADLQTVTEGFFSGQRTIRHDARIDGDILSDQRDI
jgi:FMN phosphatase YigB (HAD superfamily)